MAQHSSPIRSTHKRKCNWIDSESETELRQEQEVAEAIVISSADEQPAPQIHLSGYSTPSPTKERTQRKATKSDKCPPIRKSNSKPLRSSTPCASASPSGCPSSSYIPEERGTTITFKHLLDTSWETLTDTSLDTSTPGYKRGIHDKPVQRSPQQLEQEARDEILDEGMNYSPLPTWMHRVRPASVHILADHHLGNWPIGDRLCKFSYFQHLPLIRWNDKLQYRDILIRAGVVVLYLQKIRHTGHTTFLKERVAQMCKAVRRANPDTRVFICDTLPSTAMLENQQVSKFNRELFVAVQQVNREMENIFYLSMNAHFSDVHGNLIHPADKYFKTSGELTYLGCVIFRACLCREVGITSYTL